MTILSRPEDGRWVGGVAAGLAEYYELHPILLRTVIASAILSAPVLLLVYLLLWVSMPGEASSLNEFRLRGYADATQRERFERLSAILLRRTKVIGRRRTLQPQLMAFCMLVLAFAFQIPRLEGASFYTNHPITSSLFSNVSRHATAFFYVAVAFTFLAMDRIRTAPVDLRIARKDRVILDAGDFRSIIGLVSGLGRVTGLDPAYIRVAFVLLNVLTFGLVGLIYLLYYVWLRRSGRKEYEHSTTIEEPKFIRPLGAVVRITLGFLFLLLALIRVSTEFRLFFFNEPFFQGIVLILVGCIFTASALRSHQRAGFERLWLLGGAVVLLNGIYELTTAVFQVQLPFAGRFELIYLVGGLSVAYYTLVSLNGQRQRAGFGLAALFFLAALMVQASLAPTHLMLALVQFYDFFFPVIFAGFGLWLVLES